MRYKNPVFFSLVIILLTAACAATPVAEQDRVDIDLRRTTLIVSDIENSLRLYRDALGFKVIYDSMIRTPRSAKTDAESEISRRLVFVRANDDYIGIIGLLQYTKPLKPVRAREPIAFSTGTAVLLFSADDVDAKYAAAIKVPGVKPLDPPTAVTYPSYDGNAMLAVRTSALYDPDGFLIELNSRVTKQ